MSNVRPYIAFANDLRKNIIAGKYGTEGGLPGIEELVRRSGLARNTIYRALAILEGEGIILSRDKSFFVNASSITMTGYVLPHHARLQAQGKTGFIRNVVPVATTPLPDDLADMFKLPRGTRSVRRYRIGGEIADSVERPTCLLNYHYLMPIGDELITRMNADASLDVWADVAPVQVKCHDSLASRLPTEEEARLLRVPPESTAISDVQTLSTTQQGEPLTIQETVFIGVVFNYNYDYERPEDVQ